jgi:small GTP-binding protein
MPDEGQDNHPSEHQEHEIPHGVKLLRNLEGHVRTVMSVAFDPTGQMLASGSDDQTVKLWDTASGKLIRTLDGHKDMVGSVEIDPTGQMLASASNDQTVKLWDTASGKLIRTLKGHKNIVSSVAFDPTGQILASAGIESTVKLWDAASGKLICTLKGHTNMVRRAVFDPTGQMLASGSDDQTVKLWDTASGKLIRTLVGHDGFVLSVAFDPTGRILASGGTDKTVKLWDTASGKLIRTLEGYTNYLHAVTFSIEGRLLASKSDDGTLQLWSCDTWEAVVIIPQPEPFHWTPCLAFHPRLPLLATSSPNREVPENQQTDLIRLFELDLDVLLGKVGTAKPAREAVYHTTAKVVLVGDHSVGKSGLGWRLAHGEFKEQHSTHGQQFWVLPQLGKLREDGTECEAILWDLAGQPDYRLIHALFLDDVDLALVLFDSSNISDPLHGVEFWLKQLKCGQGSGASEADKTLAGCPTILVGAQADRGTPTLTLDDLEAFCKQRGISGYLSTSALRGWGLEELLERMKELIRWEDKPTTVTTVTFKRIKDFVLKLKENLEQQPQVIVSPQELRGQLERTDAEWRFTDAEMMTAVGHLENYGYVKRLRTSKGEERVLLAPELLNNLAASFVLEARRNLKGLGSLEEKRLLEGGYTFTELERLSQAERDILLDSATLLFLEHNVCFRETDPLGGNSYLVFPELINLRKPVLENEQATDDGVAYAVSGAIENVYASLVVLLGYTQTFTRTNQWQRQARYVMGDGSICGFRREGDRDGELEFVLYFGTNVLKAGQKVFEGLFESFLARRNLTVFRYEPVSCSNEHTINRAVVRERLRGEKGFAFCEECGEKVVLQKADEPIQLTQTERRKVVEQRWFADRRTQFEQAIFQVMSYVKDKNLAGPECFISYAWGDKAEERWVERNLAPDLQKAGINVVLDKWENARIGMSVPLFVERIEKCDRVIVVGTPLYRKKYENKDTSTGYVVAAEVELISNRLLGTNEQKESVLPLLLEGEKDSSLPPLLHSRVFADFRHERSYFIMAFDLILSLYKIAPNAPAVADLREALRFEMR